MNLKDFYSEEQVTALLGYPVKCRGMLHLRGGVKFYPRDKINSLLFEKAKPYEIFKINEKIISQPAYNLDLNEWIQYMDAVELIPYSKDILLEINDAKDRLKPIRTRRLYDITFYNKADILKLLGDRDGKKYYMLSKKEVDELDIGDGDHRAFDKYSLEKIAGWYSPAEARILLKTKLRTPLTNLKVFKWFGQFKFYEQACVHNNSPNNWENRASYIQNNRLYPADIIWKDWFSIWEMKDFIYWTTSFINTTVKENRILTYDIGGVFAYHKASWLKLLNDVSQDLIYPFVSSNLNNSFKSRIDFLRYLDEKYSHIL